MSRETIVLTALQQAAGMNEGSNMATTRLELAHLIVTSKEEFPERGARCSCTSSGNTGKFR